MKLTRKLGMMALVGYGAAMALQKIQQQSRWIDLSSRVAVITGGSRGLGLVLARQFAEEDVRLALLARDETELDRAKTELKVQGAKVFVVTCDVRDRESVQAAIDEVMDHYGRIDILVNNAGVIQTGPLDHMSTTDFEEAMAVHTWGPLYMIQAVTPIMRRQKSGRIVNIASIGGKVSVPHLVPYSTSKFALAGLSDGIRAELAPDGIYVTTVFPGLMRTGSHVNALFKGRQAEEYAWFSALDSLPFTSTSAEKAARQIVSAAQHGDPQLVITPQAQLLSLLNTVAPRLTATVLTKMNEMLPDRTTEEGNRIQTGWESQSPWAPSLLTRLADQASEKNNELGSKAPIDPDSQKPMSQLVTEKSVNVLKKAMEVTQMTTHKFTKTIIVQGDLSKIFDIWANFENFPHFMQNIKSVTKTDDKTSHWIMSGPLGKMVEWDAKTTTLEPNKRIAWNSTNQGDNDITTSGQVSFNPLPDNQVEVTVTLQYIPPAGKAGEIVANLLDNPEGKLETDLRNFKAYAEQQSSLVTS